MAFQDKFVGAKKDTNFDSMIRDIFKYVKGRQFLPKYCGIEYTAWTRRKMVGKDNAGNDLDFTEAEKDQIRKGWARFVAEMGKNVK